jgi:hypothetical protein
VPHPDDAFLRGGRLGTNSLGAVEVVVAAAAAGWCRSAASSGKLTIARQGKVVVDGRPRLRGEGGV